MKYVLKNLRHERFDGARAGRLASRSGSVLRRNAEPAGAPQAPPNHTVTQADMDRWKVELSNAGRWGKDDQKGALNLITRQSAGRRQRW